MKPESMLNEFDKETPVKRYRFTGVNWLIYLL